ncbi:MAG: terminase small subunit [Eubacteriales bacterium]
MLTEQKKLFVDEYIRTGCKNATQAAKNAGYSARSAGSQAHDLLKTPEVQAYLSERKAAFVKDIQEEFVYHARKPSTCFTRYCKTPRLRTKTAFQRRRNSDRAGFKPPEQVTLSGEIKSNPFAGLTTDELAGL